VHTCRTAHAQTALAHVREEMAMARSLGRPKTIVDIEQIKRMRSLRFTWKEIESLLHVSSKTLQRRAKEWNIERFTDIDDQSLDEIVREIKSQFPASGEVMIRGHLNSRKVYSIHVAISLPTYS